MSSAYISNVATYLQALKGSFSSPNYPDRYPIDQHCFWTIVSQSEDEHLYLTFGHFDVWTDPSDPTNCDKGHYVQLYEGQEYMNKRFSALRLLSVSR